MSAHARAAGATRARPLPAAQNAGSLQDPNGPRPPPVTWDRSQALKLRAGSLTDAERSGMICYEAFKTIAEEHAFPPDFPSPEIAIELMHMMLGRPDVFALVAELNGEIIGSNFLWEGGSVAGVGPISIDPAEQNGGIGRRLMEAVITRAEQQGIGAVRLVQAAYHTRSLSLYTKLGFSPREPLVLLQGRPLGLKLSGYVVRLASESDIGAASDVSRHVHGHDRTGELIDAISRQAATVVEHKGRVTGYTTGIGFFGHAVGTTTEDVKALIAAATAFDGPGFLLPIRDSDLFRWCLQNGLQVVQPMTLMSMGPYQEPRGSFLPSILY